MQAATAAEERCAGHGSIKTIAVAGGLEEALSVRANAVRSNFKVTKDKKSGPG